MIRSQVLNLIVKLVVHLSLIGAIGFALFLYSNDYEVFPWATQDEDLKFLHLIMTIPYPIMISIVANVFVNRVRDGLNAKLLKVFPLSCLILISGYFFMITSLDPTRLKMGFGICILLFLMEIYLSILDLMKSSKRLF